MNIKLQCGDVIESEYGKGETIAIVLVKSQNIPKNFCNECLDSGKQSIITEHGRSQTLIASQPYYDKDGNYHSSNPNVTTIGYKCSNGHFWMEKQ